MIVVTDMLVHLLYTALETSESDSGYVGTAGLVRRDYNVVEVMENGWRHVEVQTAHSSAVIVLEKKVIVFDFQFVPQYDFQLALWAASRSAHVVLESGVR